MASSAPLRAFDFVNGIGVDTHLPYTDGGYANANTVIADLNYLGINHVRDGVMDDRPYPGDEGQLSYATLAAAGIKFVFDFQSGLDIPHSLALMAAFEQQHPGSIVGIEGPNEVNNWPVTYNGETGSQAAVDFQNALYAWARATPGLAGIPVLNMTSSTGLAGGADDSNLHVYAANGDQPLQSLLSGIAAEQSIMPGHGTVVTEAGYYTLPAAGGVDLATDAKLTLNLVMDAAKSGVQGVYLYQLLDAYADPQGLDPQKHYGLFDAANAPKPAATAIHNLTSILSDSGAGAASFATTPASFTTTGMTSADANLVTEKSNGATDLVFWSEPNIWNPATHNSITVAPHTVSVALDKVYTSVSIYDPLVSDRPIASLGNVSSVQLGVTDHPLVVELSPSSSPLGAGGATLSSGVATSTAVLTVKVSGDQFGAELPMFQVYVDGKAVGDPQTVAAVHAAGQWDTVALPGSFDPSSAHQVQVQFLNDAYDGVHDRNLYVEQVSLNGQPVAGSAASSNTAALGFNGWDSTAAVMAGNGVASFAVAPSAAAAVSTPATAASTPASPAASGLLSLKVSGDQFGADLPSFQVYVDGKAEGGPQSVSALHGADQWNTISIHGVFDPTVAHQVQVQFLNDAYDGVHDRNLYVGQVTLNGVTEAGAQEVSNSAALGFDRWDPTAAVMAGNGTARFTFGASTVATPAAATPAATPANPSAIVVTASGDQFGDQLPSFQLYVDGARVGSVQTVSAQHGSGQWQTIEIDNAITSAGPHQVEVRFINDAWDGVHDRNLYVEGFSLNGHAYGVGDVASNSAALGFDSWDPHAAVLAGNGGVVYDVFGT